MRVPGWKILPLRRWIPSKSAWVGRVKIGEVERIEPWAFGPEATRANQLGHMPAEYNFVYVDVSYI